MSQKVYFLRHQAGQDAESNAGGRVRQSAERPIQKRLQILDDAEIEALYGRPQFTPDDRLQFFTLTQPECDARACLRSLPSQFYFMLQLAYFKAKQLFFTFTFTDVADDLHYGV